jgi:hypothetical protein
MADYAFYTYSQRPNLGVQAKALNPSVWPEFMSYQLEPLEESDE